MRELLQQTFARLMAQAEDGGSSHDTSLMLGGAGAVLAVVTILLVRELRAPRNAKEKAVAPPPAAGPELSEEDLTHVGRRKLPQVNSTEESGSFSKSVEMTVYASEVEGGEEDLTGPVDCILTSAVGQTDVGKKRQKNEDSFLVMSEQALFVVADGVGGHVGGDLASSLATDTIGKAFKKGVFKGEPDPGRPHRANELAWAIHEANEAIHLKSKSDRDLEGMATTILCARFSPKKRRVYVAYVGDSPGYRLRGGKLSKLTVDHTMARAGITGPMGAHLSRALGIRDEVSVDMVIDAPESGDRYLLCSDGLSKMVSDEVIRQVLERDAKPERNVKELIELANARGGHDNVTVIVIRVDASDGRPVRA